MNQKQKELNQKTFHDSLLFINNFHLKPKILLYTQNSIYVNYTKYHFKILFEKETDRERCQAKINIYIIFRS